MPEIHVKNMVCNRCNLVVSNILKELKIDYSHVDLGKVELPDEPTQEQLARLREEFEKVGFEIIGSQKSLLIEKVKNTVIDLIYNRENPLEINYSAHIEQQVGRDYNYLSNLFSETVGQTIEKYIIHQKIERVKELLVYEQQTLSEIAFDLGYSSVSHLSKQFKKVTGLTPSHFKQIGESRRKSIDQV